MAIIPGNGTEFGLLGPNGTQSSHAANGTPDTYVLHGTPMHCGALVRVGLYPESSAVGRRILVSPNLEPLDALVGCAGMRIIPVPTGSGNGTPPLYRFEPSQGVTISPQPVPTLYPTHTVFLKLSTRYCGNQTVDGITVTNDGLVKARWSTGG